MKRLLSRTVAISILLLVIPITFANSAPKPKVKFKDPAVMTLIHAIPATFGADKVDIYSNGALILNDATPGSSKTFFLDAGTQQLSIYADGVLPASETTAILSFRPIYLANGMDVSFVAHLDSNSQPTLSLFKNMNTEPGRKRAWLTVRHVAAAPAIDVRTGSIALFNSLTSGLERKRSLRFGSYPVNVVLAGTATNALSPTNVEVEDNKNLIVYVWGSAARSNLQYLTQVVNTK